VFTRTKHGADRVVRQLEAGGIEASAIHGNKSQGQRERALGAFRAGTCRVLVATDIAARGIDVEGVTHVINYDLPNVPESYVHRICRTARAGAAGEAISFCNDEERAYLRDIEKLTRLKVPVRALPQGLPAIAEPAREPRAAERSQGAERYQGRPTRPHRGGPAEGRNRGPERAAKPVGGRGPGPGQRPAAKPAPVSGSRAESRPSGRGFSPGQGSGAGGRDGQLAWLDRARQSPR